MALPPNSCKRSGAPAGARRSGLILALAAVTAHASCWPPQDKALWADDELDGRLTLSFRNALSCAPVANAELAIGEQEYRTDGAGLLRLPRQTGNTTVPHSLMVNAAGFQTTRFDLPNGDTDQHPTRLALSPRLDAGNARFVLTWGEQPADLDLHFLGPQFHVSARHARNIDGFARLERDAADGYGPETVTAFELRPDAHYEIWVHIPGGNKTLQAAQLQLYFPGDTVLTATLPTTSERWIKAAEIDRGIPRLLLEPRTRGP